MEYPENGLCKITTISTSRWLSKHWSLFPSRAIPCKRLDGTVFKNTLRRDGTKVIFPCKVFLLQQLNLTHVQDDSMCT